MPVGAVSYLNPALEAVIPLYDVIEDCLAGEIAVKGKGIGYLPMPNALDTSPSNIARYSAYKTRANFYNVSRRTLNGLVGQIFMREPNIKVPSLLDVVVTDVNGEGVDIVQQAKEAAKFVLSRGRAGLYVDYPEVTGPVTRDQTAKGNIRPTMALYGPKAVINWRTMSRGAKELLSLVVLEETYIKSDDGFKAEVGVQWRVLKLINDVYTVEIYRDEAPDVIHKTFQPRDGKGNLIDEIPFIFIGVTKNDSSIDFPPLYDICSVNLAHYRNSADYEEGLFLCGQPTPVVSGITEEWAKNVLNGQLEIGSRAVIMLPVGGEASLLQAEAKGAGMEAMEHKERLMTALGAKLVEQKTVQRTATEAEQDNAAETSDLSATAKNVSDAYKWGLEWCAIFAGLADPTARREGLGSIEFDLNTEFDLVNLSPDERRQTIAEWTAGAITFEEMRDNLTRAGVATMTVEVARSKIAKEAEANLGQEVDRVTALSEAAPDTKVPE